MTNERFHSTRMLSDIAWGENALFGSLAESDADIERASRRARWERRKSMRDSH